MHRHLGNWLRQIHPEPTSDYVRLRSAAIAAVAKKPSVHDVVALARLVWSLPLADPVFVDRFADAFRKEDAAFPMRENEHELSVLAGATLITIMKEGTPTSDIAALASVSAEGAGLRHSCSLPDLSAEAENHLLQFGKKRRSREVEKDVPTGIDSASKKSMKDYASQLAQNAWNEAAASVTSAVSAVGKAADQLSGAVEDLRSEVEILREQQDILWWLFGGFSLDTNAPLTQSEDAAAVLMVGHDLAILTSFSPGPVASGAFISKMLSSAKLTRKKVSVADAVNALDVNIRREWVSEQPIALAGLLCPVSFAVHRSLDSPGARMSGNIANFPLDERVPAQDMAFQIFIETLLLRDLSTET